MDAPFSKVFVLDNTSTQTSNVMAENNRSFIYQLPSPSPSKVETSPEKTSNEYLTKDENSFNTAANNLAAKDPHLQKVFRTLKRLLQRKQTEMSTVTSTTGPATVAARKQTGSAEQGEPAKPLSAYALFFRDTVSAIKQQNPTCSFQELSKIVASMWDILDPVHKDVYNKKNELARVEYLKQMRIYQQQQLEKQEQLNANANESLQSDANGQQTAAKQETQPIANNSNIPQVNSNQVTSSNAQTTSNSGNSGGPTSDSVRPPNEAGQVQKCTRENCNKPAIVNPDWEDEYCSNECVIIHCRDVFNDWVQSNLEARRQQQQQQHMNTV